MDREKLRDWAQFIQDNIKHEKASASDNAFVLHCLCNLVDAILDDTDKPYDDGTPGEGYDEPTVSVHDVMVDAYEALSGVDDGGEALDTLGKLLAVRVGTPGEYDCGVNPADNPVCKWTEDADGVWNGTCGIAWQCENDTPEANGMRCCPKCGRALWFTRCETYERNTRAVPPGGWSAAKKRIEDFFDDPETAPDDDWIARHAPDKVTEALRLLNLYPAFTIDYARTLAAAVRELSYACAHPYPKPHDHPRKADAMAIAVAVEAMGHE